MKELSAVWENTASREIEPRTGHCLFDAQKTLPFKWEGNIYSAEDKKKTGRGTRPFIVHLFIERGRFHFDALAGQLLYCAPGDNGFCTVHSNGSKVATCRLGEKVTRGRGVTETRK